MKKTLLIAAAALAASVISSQAQVYSQNIVGYVNIPVNKGYNCIANPLDCGNSLTNVIDNSAGVWNYTLVNFWNGIGYTTVTIDNGFPTGVGDAGDNFGVPAPTVNPGSAFFFQNNTGSSNTLTIAGSVHIGGPAVGGGTVGVATNLMGVSPQKSFIGSVIPVGGGMASVLQFPTNNAANYTLLSFPNINGVGNITGFTTYTVDNSFTSGFADAGDNFEVAEPVLKVASGFFFSNNSGSPIPWSQSF